MTEAAKERRNLQNVLDQEQAVVDLDQGIADREQARVDREQEPLDAAQAALAAGTPEAAGSTRSHAARSTEIGLRQDRQDAHQAQIDQTQLAQGVRQDVLDQQQVGLETPPCAAQTGDDDLLRAGEELEEALRHRAEEALVRAECARQRAADTLCRLEASRARQQGRQDRRP
jgi:hypothetical protein